MDRLWAGESSSALFPNLKPPEANNAVNSLVSSLIISRLKFPGTINGQADRDVPNLNFSYD